MLIHEATLENSMKDKAIENGHSTPSMAAEFALTVNAKCLALYHFSQRYKSLEEADENEEVCKGSLSHFYLFFLEV